METNGKVTLQDTDLATYLARMSDQLRAEALALTGLAHENWAREDHEFQALDTLVYSLDRKAEILDSMKATLCQSCALVEVREILALAKRRNVSRAGGRSAKGKKRTA